MIAKRCPECGGEMIGHRYNGRLYYICKNCNKELIIPEIAYSKDIL